MKLLPLFENRQAKRSEARKYVLEVQQQLLDKYENLEIQIALLTDDDNYRSGKFDILHPPANREDLIGLSATVLDMKPVIITVGVETLAVSSGSAQPVKTTVDEVTTLLLHSFIEQCKLFWSAIRDIKSVFEGFVLTGKVSSIHDVIEVVIDKSDKEGSENIETNYNGTVYGTRNKADSEVFLIVKGV